MRCNRSRERTQTCVNRLSSVLATLSKYHSSIIVLMPQSHK